jgi:antitoxin component YwqK of YwqJK toxin-antitoxin module
MKCFFTTFWASVIVLFTPIFSTAQVTTATTVFKGVEYNIYPVRVSMKHKQARYGLGEISGYNKSPHGEEYLPFNPFNLPDGQYLAYLPKRQRKWDKHTKRPIFSHEDTTLVAVTFLLKNNKKNGMANWYSEEKQRLIQQGYFIDGIKTGEWKLMREKSTVRYTYVDGMLHGEWKRYRKGALRYTSYYKHGYLDGVSKALSKKGALRTTRVYENGSLVSRVDINKKGIVTWHMDNSSKDTIIKSFNDEGRLKMARIRTADSNLFEVIRLYSSQNLRSKVFEYETEWYFTGAYVPDSVTAYEVINYLLNNDLGTVSAVKYHSNGQIRYSYDISQFPKEIPVKVYNKEGEVIREVSVYSMPKDTNYVWIKDISYSEYNRNHHYGKLKKFQKIEKYHISQHQPIASYYIDKKGIPSYERTPYYLDHQYEDSSGSALLNTSSRRKRKIEYFNILHSQKMVKRVSKKGVIYEDFTALPYGTDSSKKVHLTISKWSKDKLFRVDHRQVVEEQNKKLDNDDDKELLEVTHLQDLADTLDYMVFYQNTPFTGGFKLENSFKSKSFAYKVKYRKRHSKWYGPSLKIKRYDANWKMKSGHSKVYDGEVQELKHWRLKDVVSYEENLKEGEQLHRDLNMSTYYIKGQKHGLEREEDGSYEYYFNALHGDYVRYKAYTPNDFLEYQLSLKMNYQLDTAHGWFVKYAAPQKLKERVYIDHGYPTGDYWYGNVTAPTTVSAKLDHGYLIDTARYYFAEGILKAQCIHSLKDSVFYAGPRIEKYGFSIQSGSATYEWVYDSRPTFSNRLVGDVSKYVDSKNVVTGKMVEFDANRTGDYVYQYKNGVMSMRGRVEKGFRVGVWEFWDLNGGKLKRISYEKGIYLIPGSNDTVKYFATIEMWHPNGKQLLEGFVISEFTQFKCDQEMAVNFENIHYLSMYDTHGEQVLKNNSGQIYEYHNNGLLRVEGSIDKGKRSGVWKHYDPDGRLEEVGKYVGGLKDGLWISGDLEAVPHYYDRCVLGELAPYSLPDIDGQQEVTTPIHIREVMYDLGREVYAEDTYFIPLFGVFTSRSRHSFTGTVDF